MKKKMLAFALAGIMFGGAALPVYAGDENGEKSSLLQLQVEQENPITNNPIATNIFGRVWNSISKSYNDSEDQYAIDLTVFAMIVVSVCLVHNKIRTGLFMPNY